MKALHFSKLNILLKHYAGDDNPTAQILPSKNIFTASMNLIYCQERKTNSYLLVLGRKHNFFQQCPPGRTKDNSRQEFQGVHIFGGRSLYNICSIICPRNDKTDLCCLGVNEIHRINNT